MIKINKNLIFDYKKPPLIIAEISGNHLGSKSRFLKLIESACKNGADLVKIQTYEPDDMTIHKKTNLLRIKSGLWKNEYLWDLYKKACTPYSWHNDAFKVAKKFNKVLFSTPFSIKAVDFLEKFKVPLYKISSFEITDFKLIDYIASKRKTIIMFTGMSTITEIKRAIKIINKYHNKIVILHCVSNYPTDLRDTEINKINILKKKFKKYLIGLSDHSNNIFSSIASLPFNIVAIEKHFSIDNKKTPDSEFSINPKMLYDLKKSSHKLHSSLFLNHNMKIQKGNIKLRRSIFAKEDIKKNNKITEKNIISLRPSIGINAKDYFKIIGKKAKKNLEKDEPIFYGDIK